MNKIILLLLLLTGCDKIISRQLVTEYDETTTKSCTHSGYCYGYLYTGKYGYGFSSMCSGRQDVINHVKVYNIQRESGKTESNYRESTTKEILSSCK